MQDKFENILLERNLIDKAVQTIIIDFDDWYAVVHDLKDGYHVKYHIWYEFDDGYWNYERSES